MKKIIALIGLGIVLSNFSFVSAQLHIGGNVSFAAGTSESSYYASDGADEYSNNSIRISPQVGYFLNDNLLIGVGVGFSNYKSNSENEDYSIDTVYLNTHSYNRNSIVINPFIRHYINLGEKVSLFNQLGFRYSIGRFDVEDYWASGGRTRFQEGYNNSYTAYLKPSISMSLSEKLSLELSFIELYYSHSKNNSENWLEYGDENIVADPKEERKSKANSYGLRYNSIEMGLSYKF